MTDQNALLKWIDNRRKPIKETLDNQPNKPLPQHEYFMLMGILQGLYEMEQFINSEEMSTIRAEEAKNEALERFYRRYMGSVR